MPTILDPNSTQKFSAGKGKPLSAINHGYRYPKGINLRPGRETHQRLLKHILQYARDSFNRMGRRHKDWREIDRVLKTYTYLPPTGPRKKSLDEHGAEVDEMRRIVMPVSSVVLDTLLTYMTSAFMRPPIFRYEGTGPEDILGSMLLTEVVQRQVHHNAVMLSLHTAWRDMFAYGVGYASPRWDVELGRVTRLQSFGILDEVKALFREKGMDRVTSDYEILFEGNRLDNIDPYLALPDPAVSAHEVQEGEYFGWIDETVLGHLERSEDAEGMFNVKYLRDMDTFLVSDIRSRGERETRQNYKTHTSNPVDLLWMYIDLIPKDWKIGKSDRPETWVAAVAADTIIVKLEPLENTHGKIPVVAGAPDFDGYSAAPLSRLMSIEELQLYTDFLYTSHYEDIRRSLNGNIVYDPSLINTNDLNTNKPGKLIRARKKAWGLGSLKENIFQLDTRDVTSGNINEAQFLMEQAKQATSTMDSLAGSLAPRTSRISANEAQGTRLAGLSRLERPAQLISHQFMLPIARMFASNVQQFMTEDTFVKATGELAQRLAEDFGLEASRERVPVTPNDLVVNYDVSAHDGVVPGKEDPQAWVELYTILAQNPELAKGFNMQGIFKHIARQLGATNVDAFVRQPPIEVRSDEEVIKEVDKGNLVASNGQPQ